MKTVRFGLIGAGRAGLVHATNAARRMSRARLVSVCDANPETAKAVAADLGAEHVFTDYRQALDSDAIDAAVIVVPTFLHREVAVYAAERGKHVFLEKPMALTVAECDDIIAAATKANVTLQIGFMRRFDDNFRAAQARIAAGEMGRPMIIKSTGRGPGGPGPWMWDLRKSNGIVAEVNSHDIDSVQWLVGQPITRVFAQGRNFKMDQARAQFPDFYDNVVAQLDFAGGTMGTIDGTCPAGYGYDARVEIVCENGLIQIGSMQQHGLVNVSLDGAVQGQAVKSWRTLFKEAYLAELEDFVDCVLTGRRPRVTGDDGRSAVAVVTAINASIRTGSATDVALGGRA